MGRKILKGENNVNKRRNKKIIKESALIILFSEQEIEAVVEELYERYGQGKQNQALDYKKLCMEGFNEQFM